MLLANADFALRDSDLTATRTVFHATTEALLPSSLLLATMLYHLNDRPDCPIIFFRLYYTVHLPPGRTAPDCSRLWCTAWRIGWGNTVRGLWRIERTTPQRQRVPRTESRPTPSTYT